jgi:tetratricopeptide (TPR) repeat protein
MGGGRLWCAATSALLVLGCAAQTPGPNAPATAGFATSGERRIQLEPMQIQGAPDPLTGLDAFDASDLLARGNALSESKDFDHAAKVYAMLEKRFPDSEHVPDALFNAGLAYESLAEFEQARASYARLIQEHPNAPRMRDAYYRLATCLSKLARWQEVADTFWQIRQAGGLSTMDELEARAGSGVAMFMLDDYDTAEKEFMQLLSFYEQRTKDEYLSAGYWVGQARFYLGEINARRFERYRIDEGPLDKPELWKEKVGAELEEKCQLLLRAQNNLIRAIRVGHPGWATAAGFRIGSLYERLYEDMMAVPVPPGLSDGAKEEYLNLVRERISVLVSKAIQIYERSLEMAERVGERNEWVERTAAALERMKALALKSLRASG